MGNRHVKFSCTSCSAIFRMTRKWITSGMTCPRSACQGKVLEGDYQPAKISTEAMASIRKVTEEVAIAAAEELNEVDSVARQEFDRELERRRVHIRKRKRGVYTQGG